MAHYPREVALLFFQARLQISQSVRAAEAKAQERERASPLAGGAVWRWRRAHPCSRVPRAPAASARGQSVRFGCRPTRSLISSPRAVAYSSNSHLSELSPHPPCLRPPSAPCEALRPLSGSDAVGHSSPPCSCCSPSRAPPNPRRATEIGTLTIQVGKPFFFFFKADTCRRRCLPRTLFDI